MKFKFRKILISLISVGVTVYFLFCGLLYFTQENIIFRPKKLAKNYSFEFPVNYEEKFYEVEEGVELNSVLLFTESSTSKGLVFYLHGNARSIRENAWIHSFYNQLGYDFLIIDYRGYGKSDGENRNEKQMMNDIQLLYNDMKKKYPEERIILQGYSLGSGIATQLAATNDPALLILMAPYYSMEYMARKHYPVIPPFILKYPFLTSTHIKNLDIPIYIFHGMEDRLIGADQSSMLSKLNNSHTQLSIIPQCSHREVLDHQETRRILTDLLQGIK